MIPNRLFAVISTGLLIVTPSTTPDLNPLIVTPALRSVVNEPVNVTPTRPLVVIPNGEPPNVTPIAVVPLTPNTGIP